MIITGIDHVTVRVRPADVEAMRRFYADLLGLRVGTRLLSFPGLWLYIGEQAVLHVAGNLPEDHDAATVGFGAGFDHVAFRTAGLDAAKRQLDAAGVEWKEVWRPHLGILQLVLADPAGTKVELTFNPAEHPAALATADAALAPAQAAP